MTEPETRKGRPTEDQERRRAGDEDGADFGNVDADGYSQQIPGSMGSFGDQTFGQFFNGDPSTLGTGNLPIPHAGDDHNRNSAPQVTNQTTQPGSSMNRKLACPFHKWDPLGDVWCGRSANGFENPARVKYGAQRFRNGIEEAV
jgi:hypothetical protein